MTPLEQKLLNLLSDHNVTFFIPPYQRNYEWTEEQCSAFFEDVIKTANLNLNNDLRYHFFGTITYFRLKKALFGEPDKLILIDGQQRITTTMLFLAAVRDLLKDSQKSEIINDNYLINQKIHNINQDNRYKIKLKQIESDWNAYCEIILQNEFSTTDLFDKASAVKKYKV